MSRRSENYAFVGAQIERAFDPLIVPVQSGGQQDYTVEAD